MADMQRQIDSVREAFSVDIRKPFVLKLPYGSPQSRTYSSTPRSHDSGPHGLSQQDSFDQPAGSHLGYSTHPISPPVSAGPLDTTKGEPSPGALAMMAAGPSQVMPGALSLGDQSSWNPARIFAFVAPALPLSPRSQMLTYRPQSVEHDVRYASSPVAAQPRRRPDQCSKCSPVFRCR